MFYLWHFEQHEKRRFLWAVLIFLSPVLSGKRTPSVVTECWCCWMPFSFVQVARQSRSSLHTRHLPRCLWLCPLRTLTIALSPRAPAPCRATRSPRGQIPSEQEGASTALMNTRHFASDHSPRLLVCLWAYFFFLEKNISNILLKWKCSLNIC